MDDLCIFCHHHINHNHSCCVQAFSPLLSRFPRCWVWCSSTEMNPCFQTSISFTSSPFVTLTPDPIPPFPKCSPLLHPEFWTLFSSSSPVIFSSVGFSRPTFSSGAHELTFSTFTFSLLPEMKHSFQRALWEFTFSASWCRAVVISSWEKSEGTSDWCKQTSLKTRPDLKFPLENHWNWYLTLLR